MLGLIRPVRSVAILTALLASACFTVTDGGQCSVDDHCGSGFSCTRTAECVATSQLSSTRLTWTVDGVTPSPSDVTPCAGIAELEIIFDDSFNGLATHYAPVPCNLGQVFYDKMPPRFDLVILVAKDNAGRRVDRKSASIRPGENVVDLDLRP